MEDSHASPPTLPARAVRGGVQIGISMTRRTVGHTRSTDGSRLKRVLPALVLLPLLAALLTAAAILFALFLLVVVLVTVALALTALVPRRRPGRAS